MFANASILDNVVANEPSTLNPDAKSFVPRAVLPTEDEGRRIDHAMATMHHFATVNDTETLNMAEHWVNNHSPDHFYADGSMGYWMEREDMMRDQLYQAPQQAKGNTYGRSRKFDKYHR